MLLFLLVIVHLAHIIMQRNINQGRVVRKELWAAKSDDMGAVKKTAWSRFYKVWSKLDRSQSIS